MCVRIAQDGERAQCITELGKSFHPV